MIKKIIFDMDGILIDSVPLWRRAKKEVFDDLNFELTEKQQNETMGYSIEETVAHWFSLNSFDNVSQREVVEKIQSRVIELIKKEGKMILGIEDVLKFANNNFSQIGLASSSSYMVIDAILEKLNFKKYFQVVCSAQDEEFGKPHPAVYIAALRKLKIKYHECVVIEDSLQGVLSAKSAKIKCLAIPNKYCRNDNRLIIADYVFDSSKNCSFMKVVSFG